MYEIPSRVAVLVIALALGWVPLACVAELGALDDQTAGAAADEASALGVADLAPISFLSIAEGGRYDNGFTITVRAPSTTDYVVYSADGWVLGVATDVASGFAAVGTFGVLGRRRIVARAFSDDDEQQAEAQATVEVLAADALTAAPTVTFLSPATAEGWYENGVWLKATVGGEVKSVRYSADGWAIGTSDAVANDFALRHTFSQTGRRVLVVEGLDAGGRVVARAERPIVVLAPDGGNGDDDGDTSDAPVISPLPYFYQYANRRHPGASCQNTSIAMVLGAFGWRGVPDDITARHGKDRAQSPAGLAAVFNEEAARAGIAARLSARTSGTIAQLRALLAADEDDAAVEGAALPVQRQERVVVADELQQQAVEEVDAGGERTLEAGPGAAGKDEDLVGPALGANDGDGHGGAAADAAADLEGVARGETGGVALVEALVQREGELGVERDAGFAGGVGGAAVGGGVHRQDLWRNGGDLKRPRGDLSRSLARGEKPNCESDPTMAWGPRDSPRPPERPALRRLFDPEGSMAMRHAPPQSSHHPRSACVGGPRRL